MTGIERIGRPTAPRVASRPAAKSGFFVPSEAAGPGQADAAAAPAATSLGSMLTLQEAGGETVEDREARRHGHDMLAALAELQRALLGGGGDGVALQRLGDLAASVPTCHGSAAGRHGVGDRPAGAGGTGAPARIVTCRLVEACSRALGGAIGHRYKPAQ